MQQGMRKRDGGEGQLAGLTAATWGRPTRLSFAFSSWHLSAVLSLMYFPSCKRAGGGRQREREREKGTAHLLPSHCSRFICKYFVRSPLSSSGLKIKLSADKYALRFSIRLNLAKYSTHLCVASCKTFRINTWVSRRENSTSASTSTSTLALAAMSYDAPQYTHFGAVP